MARIEQSIEINVPLRMAYDQMTQFEEFPRFMQGVRSVHQLDDAHLHWRAEIGGKETEWDAEITEQVTDQCIAWRNTSGPKSEGKVSFEAVAPNKTRITLVMNADEAALRHPDALRSKTPQADHDLARFKKMVESRQEPSGAWRSEIHAGQPVEPEHEWPSIGGSVIGKTSAQALREVQKQAPDATTAATHTYTSGDAMAQQVPLRAGRRQTDRGTAGGAPESEAGASQAVAPTGVGGKSATTGFVPNFLHAWEDPFNLMRRMGEEMDQFLGRWSGRASSTGTGAGQRRSVAGLREWTPPIDIARQESQWIICADLPGTRKEDVQIEINGNVLTIEGERLADQTQSQSSRRSERRHGHFYRTIDVPNGVDPNAVHASMHDGVLEITLPVPPRPTHGRRVDIRPGR